MKSDRFQREYSLSVEDGSALYSNKYGVLQIDSEHNEFKFNRADGCSYSASVFSITGKGKWKQLIDDYNYRCYMSDEHGHIPTTWVGKEPVVFLKTSAFGMCIESLRRYERDD